MANAQAWVLKQDSLSQHQKSCVELEYKITGAKTGAFLAPAPSALVGYDTGSPLTQANIDALLGSASEFVAATAFGATAMGTDALGLVLNLEGQLAYTDQVSLEVVCQLGGTTTVDIVQGQVSALPNTLAAPARMQVSAAGNIAIQFVKSGLDAATAGLILLRLHVVSK